MTPNNFRTKEQLMILFNAPEEELDLWMRGMQMDWTTYYENVYEQTPETSVTGESLDLVLRAALFYRLREANANYQIVTIAIENVSDAAKGFIPQFIPAGE